MNCLRNKFESKLRLSEAADKAALLRRKLLVADKSRQCSPAGEELSPVCYRTCLGWITFRFDMDLPARPLTVRLCLEIAFFHSLIDISEMPSGKVNTFSVWKYCESSISMILGTFDGWVLELKNSFHLMLALPKHHRKISSAERWEHRASVTEVIH